MSIASVKEQLEKLITLQKSLNKIAEQKTDIIKAGDIDALTAILKDEQKHLQAAKQLEARLMQVVQNEVTSKDTPVQLSDLIEISQGTEKEIIEDLRGKLVNELTRLKARNELNQELLQQSLQFINLNLDLLLPTIDSFNYDRRDQQDEPGPSNRSIFDTKA